MRQQRAISQTKYFLMAGDYSWREVSERQFTNPPSDLMVAGCIPNKAVVRVTTDGVRFIVVAVEISPALGDLIDFSAGKYSVLPKKNFRPISTYEKK